ncbi:MAG: DUF2201 family putative metallopeptidase, partial [Hydrogenobaculum sp.]
MMSDKNDAIFSFLLIGIPISINVDDKISNNNRYENFDALIYTDGRGIKIYGNVKNINTLFEIYGADKILKHELEHILLNHIEREKEIIDNIKDYSKNDLSTLFNIAADYIINKDLDIGTTKFKNFQLVNEEIMKTKFNLTSKDLDKKSVEEILKMMLKNNPPMKISEIIKEIKKLLKGDGFGGTSSFSHVSPNKIDEFDDFIDKNAK